MGEWRFAQEYCCEFVQDDASIFKEGWVQYYDSDDLPYMDRIIQSWDTAQTKSGSVPIMQHGAYPSAKFSHRLQGAPPRES